MSFLVVFVSTLFLITDLRKKFSLFIFLIILFSIIGFLFDLDGIFLIFLVAELTIFLLLLMTYTQLFSNYKFIASTDKFYGVFLFLIILSQYQSVITFQSLVCYYKPLNFVVSSDFFVLYYFLFEQMPGITLIVILIISFFSLFFIVMYFNLKLVKAFSTKNLKYSYLLRKQVLVKQTVFYNSLYTFQN